jgi:hypothetical protein
MSDCCSTDKVMSTFPRKQTCPSNHHDYFLVPLKTVLHHVKYSWQANLKDQGYYFCNDPECDIVYFGEDGSVINKTELRTKIAAKEKDDEALVCYCFGVSLSNAKENSDIKNFVIQQTKVGHCSCETSNPSGRCCLKDFPND